FGVTELLARIRVAFRHSRAVAASAGPVLAFGSLCIDLDRREVLVEERPVHLTALEYKILEFMARNAGKVLTQRQILEHVWGSSSEHQAHQVVVRIGHLRQKIEANPHRPVLLITEPGLGYRLCIEPRSRSAAR